MFRKPSFVPVTGVHNFLQLMLRAIPAPILLHIQEVWRVSPSVVLNLSSMIRKLFANVDGNSYCLHPCYPFAIPTPKTPFIQDI
jgi:hypothetical protein